MATSHSRTVRSSLAVASSAPSGLNATARTASVWPASGGAVGLAGGHVPQPHRPVGAGGGQQRPSGLNATPVTASVWPVSGGAVGLAGGHVPQPHRPVRAGGGQQRAVRAERHPVHRVGVAGQRRAVRLAGGRRPTAAPSDPAPAVASSGPSGLNATPLHRVGVAGQRRAVRLAGGHVPQPHRPVLAGGGQQRPSGLNATAHTAPVWPVSGAPCGWPVATSHSRTVRPRWRWPAARRPG